MVVTPEDLATINQDLVRLRGQAASLNRRIQNLEALRDHYIQELKEQRGHSDVQDSA